MIKITDKALCSGCEACANVCPKRCINMCADEKGFAYPSVDSEKCVQCGLCEKICPILNPQENTREKTAFAAYNTNETVRKASSSGGLFGKFAEEALSRNGVVCGAAFSEDFKSVWHVCIEKKEDLPVLYGSKYLQSRIGEVYKSVENFLKDGRFVLFVGTSCQAAGLKAYLRKDYENLLTADVICHGVPSPKVWSDYATDKENERRARISEVSFRDKRCGWDKSVVAISFDNGNEFWIRSAKDYYIKGFLSNLYLRDSCYECRFKGEKVLSDITLGDFWGVENILPNFSDNKGCSAVILNTEKGKSFFEGLKSDLVTEPVSYKDVVQGNPSLVKSVAKPDRSDKFWRIYGESGLKKAYSKCCKDSFARRCYRLVRRICRKIKKR